MSAVAALQYDLVLGTGTRTSFSWPVAEQPHRLLDHSLSTSCASDTSLSPPSASPSVTASPPHHSVDFGAQQREYNRKCEEFRRKSKFGYRTRAIDDDTPGSSPSSIFSTDNSGAASPPPFFQPSPPTMADLSASSATGGLPGIYSTSGASSHISLLSETATTSADLSPSPYIATGSSYSSSPLHDHEQPGVYSENYSSQSYIPEYTTSSFPTSSPQPLHAQYPRAAMNDQQGLMYHMVPPTSSSSLMHHHQPLSHHAQLPQPQLHQSQSHPAHNHSGHQLSPMVSLQAHAHNGAGTHHAYGGVVGSSIGSAVGTSGSSGYRLFHNRPKPQCWEHGCNGRQFSTFSNLLRHQREKSGQAAKAVCPNCGAEFTRTTARNGHLQHDKCKPRRPN